MRFVDISMDLHNHKSSAVQKLALTQIGLIFSLFSVINSSNNTFANSVANMNPVVISSSAKQSATVIFLHGLGDSGNGWAEAMTRIRQPYVKVICPSASPMPVSLNQGFRMPSWFDLFTLDESGPEDDEGIKKAAKIVHSLIDREIETYNIPSSRIALGGFSQGGALALYSAFTYDKPLAGVMALSCWIPLHKTFPAAAISNKDMPIMQCHGDCDPIVPLKWGQLTASILKSFAKNTELKTYRGLMHSSSDAELKDLKKFMDVILPPV
ncbi:acyl-protein thioesterase 1-like [Rhopalosiphum maidis]|uniref:acyl-protein thioesterase 1-like n=1 Tax=Rhopalosiphum maidis TaxID=43146 RepID=UPI000EFFE610|nr:acyl-protein thioesterase 1-like [Rhopalosiphum maidis]